MFHNVYLFCLKIMCYVSLLFSGACYSLVAPTPVINPEIVATSSSALALLGLSDENVR